MYLLKNTQSTAFVEMLVLQDLQAYITIFFFFKVLPLLSFAFFTYQVKGKYEILTGTFKSPDEMVDMYVELINKFPSIIALVDPLRKEVRQFM